MADVQINLEAIHKEFVAALTTASKSLTDLLTKLDSTAGAHDKAGKAAKSHADSEDKLGKTTKATGQTFTGHTSALGTLGAALVKTAAFYVLVFEAAKKVAEGTKDAFVAAIANIDDFRKASIGTAIAITNLADPIANAGRDFKDIFQQNLKATQETFIDLERISRKYFSSAKDNQLAYNQFAQRGIVLNRGQLESLVQLTTQILLLTGGQNTAIQVQEEIRDLITGTLRPTAQLAQLVRSFGKDVKEVGAVIRATQSLNPLESILVGTKASSDEIQKTFSAVMNGLETFVRQTGRVGAEGMFDTIVSAVKKFTEFIVANQISISGTLGLIGKVAGDAVVGVEKFAEQFIKGNDAVKDGTPIYIQWVAVIEFGVGALFKTAALIAFLIRDIPLMTEALAKMLSLGPAFGVLGEAITSAAEHQNKVVGAIIDKVGELWTKITGGAETTIKPLKDLKDGFEDLKKIVSADFKDAGFGGDVVAQIKKIAAELTTATNIAKAAAAKLASTERTNTAATFLPFAPSKPELEAVDRLKAAVTQAEDRLNRAQRTAEALRARADIDVDLVALQRDLTLIEQGFILSRGVVVGLHSELDEVNKFIGNNMSSVVRGEAANFEELSKAISGTLVQISHSTFNNLNQQFTRASEGLAHFKAVAEASRQELEKTEVAPHLETAAKLEASAQAKFNAITSATKTAVLDAQTALNDAIKANDDQLTKDLSKKLSARIQEQSTGFSFASRQKAFELLTPELEKQIAKFNEARLLAQEQASVETETKRILELKLKIYEQMNVQAGKVLLSTVHLRDELTKAQVEAASQLPRTELQASRATVNQQTIADTAAIARTKADLQGVIDQITALGESALKLQTQQILDGATAARSQEIEKILITSIELEGMRDNLIKLIPELEKTAAKVKETREHVVAFAASFAAIDSALTKTFDTLSDALLNSFEGKKTDIVRAFKGITDSLFKDSLKGVFDSLKTTLKTSFSDVFKSLGISDSMAATLGPAFLAGFALIASFVLGQLLGGNKASASPGNATVGITSSEQVRGLIGGETQIPIGLVGESLQNALVPTNVLLQRIAFGVERISFGGLNSQVIENVISQSINESLQIQLASH